MVDLLGEATDEMVDEVVKVILLELFHQRHETILLGHDSLWMLFTLKVVLAPPVHIDWLRFYLVRENKSAILKVPLWLHYIKARAKHLVRMKSLWEGVPFI